MSDSILQTVRSACNLDKNDSTFDTQLIPLINNELQNLAKIGACALGTYITNESTKWPDIMLGTLVPSAQFYVGQSVLLKWDPPSASAAVTALTESIKETEWTINQITEGYLT